MNKLTKIGVSALAGSLVAVSANFLSLYFGYSSLVVATIILVLW